MAIIHIDGKDFTVSPQHNLLQACLSQGLDLPYFCWHPALASVGACRQCAVKQYTNPDDKTGRIVMACMTPVTDGIHISIADSEAKAFRASVIEWMMTNHPHDCPVCEEGGECHLQDMTVMTGHIYRRYRFTKRTHRNQYLGPFIKHEMNRCIACYRCVRFYRDYAGGHDLDVQGAHNNVYFGRDVDGILENEFSGNLVEVCPTGVFTDKTLSAAYNRKWDMRSVPSVCVHCGTGCNTFVSERGGQVRRILNRFNGDVNGYFLCDRGRFGYGFTNAADRLRTPLLRERNGVTHPMAKAEVLDKLAKQFNAGGKVIGIGSPRASLEANFALRQLVGTDAFYAGISTTEASCLATIIDNLKAGTVKTATLQDVEAADAVLVLGEDVTNTAPRLALALRQAVRTREMAIATQMKIPPWQDAAVRSAAHNIRSPLFIASPTATHLDDIAGGLYHAGPDDIAQLGFAICHLIYNTTPAAEGLPTDAHAMAARIASELQAAERPLIVSGCQLGSATILQAAANIAQALSRGEATPRLMMTAPECNSLGLALMKNGSVHDALGVVSEGTVSTVIILENDLYRRADRHAVDAFFKKSTTVVALDHIETKTTAKADIFLPCANFAECEGTLVNSEGRAQRSYQAVIPNIDVLPSWLWLRDIATAGGHGPSVNWRLFDDVVRALAADLPVFAKVGHAAPSGDFRVAGSRIRSEPHRYSGRTAVYAAQTLHEPKPAMLEGSPFSSTMEGYYGQMPAALIPFFWAPGWNSGQSLHKFQEEASGALRGSNAGVRILEPHGGDAERQPTGTALTPFKRVTGQWLVVPYQHIFGSEELSAKAPAIADLCKPPRLSLNADDVRILGVQAGAEIEITLESGLLRLPVMLAPELPSGVAAMSAGLSETAGFPLPGWARLRPVVTEAKRP